MSSFSFLSKKVSDINVGTKVCPKFPPPVSTKVTHNYVAV